MCCNALDEDGAGLLWSTVMDHDHATLPRPRHDLDLIPIEHEGRELVLVRDSLELVKPGSAIDPALLHILQLLEGGITLGELQNALTHAQGGVLAPRDDCERLVAALDTSFLLDSPAYRARRAALEQEYAALTVRPTSHAGLSYPAEAGPAAELVDSLLAAGKPAEEAGVADVDALETAIDAPPLLAIVAPHIDIGVGHAGYGRAFAALEQEALQAARDGRPIERIVVLGVGHKLTESLYSVTAKDYETPLGRLRTDREAVSRLAALGPPVVSTSDWSHRDEHSIEFPTLFLQRIFRDAPDFRIVPVLCGSAHLDANEYSRELYRTHAARFMEMLAEIVSDESSRTLVVASVDFCHIGPKFGHEHTAHALEHEARQHDAALLERLAAGDAAAFWEESVRVMDRYNVCGFSAMATMLEALPKVRGEVLGYDIHHEDATRSAVSFAAVGLRMA